MRSRQVMALVLARITKAASAATLFRSKGGLLMRCVSFLLMILAVAGTSSVRGQQPEVREALRDAARDAVLEEREPARDARHEVARNVATIDKRGARNVGMSDKRCAAIGETTTSCYALRVLAALRDGDFGDRQSVREERRDDRQEGARGTSGRSARGARRSGRRPRVVTPCASCGASRRGFWRSAVGQRGTSRRSTRGARGTSG